MASGKLTSHVVTSLILLYRYLALGAGLRDLQDHGFRSGVSILQKSLVLLASLILVPRNFTNNTVLVTTGFAAKDWLVFSTNMGLARIAPSRHAVAEVGIVADKGLEHSLVVFEEERFRHQGLDFCVAEMFGAFGAGDLVLLIIDLHLDVPSQAISTSA